MPKRIQRKRTKGWRMPENAVYVGRPTKYGNPFTGPDAVEKYKNAVSQCPVPDSVYKDWTNHNGKIWILNILAYKKTHWLEELRGKDLACWCPLDKPCHADILLEIANKKTEEACVK